jgi:hypothetical protein
MWTKQETAMSPNELEMRIGHEIRSRGFDDDSYIDKNEQREIIQIAIELGGTLEGAMNALSNVCSERSYVLESRLLKQIEDEITKVVGTGGTVDQKGFNLIFDNIKREVQGKKTDPEVKRLIVQVLEDTGRNKIRTGWFSNWYANLKHELDMS